MIDAAFPLLVLHRVTRLDRGRLPLNADVALRVEAALQRREQEVANHPAAVGRGASREWHLGVVLPMLLENGVARVTNFSTSLRNGTLTVMRGLFTKAAP